MARFLCVSVAALTLIACGGDVTRSEEAIDPPAPTIPAIAESERAILQEPDLRLEPTRCPTGVPDGVRWHVTDLGASLEYKGCWTGGPTGDLVVGVLDADGLPPEAEIAGLHALSGFAHLSHVHSRILSAGSRVDVRRSGAAIIESFRGCCSSGPRRSTRLDSTTVNDVVQRPGCSLRSNRETAG